MIKIKYLRDDYPRLKKIKEGDWIDLRVAETKKLKAGDFHLLPLGIAMEVPKGYEAWMLPRSSTFSKWGVIQTNGMGIIDETYCGDGDEWFMPVYATRDVTIEKHSRICQFRIMRHQPEVQFCEVDSLDNPDRGGHGSTDNGAFPEGQSWKMP